MNAIVVLFAGRLRPQAFEPEFEGKSALQLSVRNAARFPGVKRIVLLANEAVDLERALEGECQNLLSVERAAAWTKRSALEALARLAEGHELLYFAWADAPLLDVALASALSERHDRYAAEYSYAEGYPAGFAPECLAPGTAAALAYLAREDEGEVERDLLFSVLQKDINSFDIETEISPVDLRLERLSFFADSKRDLLLVRRYLDAGCSGAADAERFVKEHPRDLRTLPAFYAIQVAGGCAQECPLCPWPALSRAESGQGPRERRDCMELAVFISLLDRIVAFSGDAVIDLSLWGEAALHPQFEQLVQAVLARVELSLILETSGLGWQPGVIERLAKQAAAAAPRLNGQAPLSIILSLDARSPEQYALMRGSGYAEAQAFAEKLLQVYPAHSYMQALRIQDGEDDLEKFYRYWKEKGANIIVQKYDHFCGTLSEKRVADLSPVKRRPCWHLMRDMTIRLDGRVQICRDDLAALHPLGSAFTDELSAIWERGLPLYDAHAAGTYPEPCGNCDEYYTYNF